jgi:inorganic pyrophosphatase
MDFNRRIRSASISAPICSVKVASRCWYDLCLFVANTSGTGTLVTRSLERIKTFDEDGNLIAIVETPRGTRTKLAFDDELGAFVVKKVLPQGMSFPFDFGFIPSTLGEDGDPLDVLVLVDEALTTGTVVPSRLIGVIEAQQTERNGETTENSRLIAVAAACQIFSDVKKLSDLPQTVVEQIEHFFVTYNQEAGKVFEPTGRRGPKRATTLVEKAIRKARRR